jgi:hypothetical protein
MADGDVMSVVPQSSDDMREEAEWMVPSDDKILELLREHGNLTPRAVEDFGGPSAGHAQDRLPLLARYGLAERISRGLYRITDEGRAYLGEELDASTLEPES